jgi:4'-phosphopantetheinyl transferase
MYLVVKTQPRVHWDDVVFSAQPHTRKPIYSPGPSGLPALEFNVSHQAGLVALVARLPSSANPTSPPRIVGVDIVCVHERASSWKTVEMEGFNSFLKMFDTIFSVAEMVDIASPDSKEEQFRRFHAFWCLKEAYLKMTGDALLADYLTELEFRDVLVPRAASVLAGSAPQEMSVSSPWGETISSIKIYRAGVLIPDVRIELQSFEADYMIGTATPVAGLAETDLKQGLASFTVMDLEREIQEYQN